LGGRGLFGQKFRQLRSIKHFFGGRTSDEITNSRVRYRIGRKQARWGPDSLVT
jgi:hypothetical protein